VIQLVLPFMFFLPSRRYRVFAAGGQVSYRLLSNAVVFNLFFDAEPFVAILIAHGTYELSKECLWAVPRLGGQKFEAKI